MNIKPPTYVSGDILNTKAYNILMNNLMSYGNTPNQAHCDALYALLRTMTEMSQGKCKGRYAFGLPTGMGKTQSIIAWVVALYELGYKTSVSISASKVEALCDIKRSLVSLGVSEETIGLLHSYQYDPEMKEGIKEGYASLPSTGKEERQFMLVTHNRVRGSEIDEHFHRYGDFQRDLMIYDESLIVSDSFGIDLKDFSGDVARLTDMHHDDEEYTGIVRYFNNALKTIQSGFDSLKEPSEVSIVELKEIDDERLPKYKALLRKVKRIDTLHQLLEIAHLPLRLINEGNSGFVTYTMAVPPEIRNILVLDASYPIRELIHMDSTIHDAEEKLPYLKCLDTPLSKLKDFSKVTVKHMNASGARYSMSNEFKQLPSDRKVLVDVCDVVKAIPPEESVLIFTFKKRTKKEVDFRLTLEKTLDQSGVSCHQTVEFNGEERQRVNIVTWGMETSLNDFNHCQHVILLGILHRAPIDLSSSIIGQSNDLELSVTNQDANSIQKSEISHLIYQAASRGTCRTVEEGYAKPMTLYLIQKDKGRVIRGMLDTVMPNLHWETWEGNYSKLKEGAIVKLAKRINEFLKSLTVDRITVNKLKKDMKVVDVPRRTFAKAREYCLDNLNHDWELHRRSLVLKIDF